MGERVVVGAGPDALRAAAVLATAGEPVCLLQGGPSPSGLTHPELPQSTGRMRTTDDVRDLVEQVMGSLVEAPGVGRGVSLAGTKAWLPMTHRDVVKLTPSAQLMAAGRGWLQARKNITETDLVAGGGQEERTYRDWVVRRMGEPLYACLYRAWATARFGHDADELSVAVARAHHAWRTEGSQQVPGGRYDVALDLAVETICRHGGRVVTDAQVAGLDLDGKDGDLHVSAVRLADGSSVPVCGPLWVARSPHTVLSWLPDSVCAPLAQASTRLRAGTLQVVCLKGEVDGLPEELHVLDQGAPFWAVISPYGIKEYAIFLSTVAAGQAWPETTDLVRQTASAAASLGLGDFATTDARVERVVEHQPTWLEGAHADLTRVVDLYQSLGIVAVGRTGTFSNIDPGTELRLAARYLKTPVTDQRDALRELVMPPVKFDDLPSSLRRFIER